MVTENLYLIEEDGPKAFFLHRILTRFLFLNAADVPNASIGGKEQGFLGGNTHSRPP
jgi:hypothetical protein